MSEYSHSLHLLGGDFAAVRQLILASSKSGRFWCANSRWACFAMFDSDDDEYIIRNCRGYLLSWSYYEDFGLRIELYRDGQGCGRASFRWGPPISGELDEETVRDGFEDNMSIGAADDPLELFELIEAASKVILAGRPADIVDRIATALKLPPWKGISPDSSAELDISNVHRHFPDARDVMA